MSVLIIYVCLAVFISFLCSLLEATILSIPEAQIAILQKQGRKTGFRLAKLKENIDRPLAAILSLNTIANTIGSAGVGAQVLKVFGNEYLALSSFLLTFTILVFSEIIPKTLGARYHRNFAPAAAIIIRFLIFVTYPIVWFLQKVTYIIPQPEDSDEAVLKRAEVVVTAEMGENEGSLQTKESEVIRNLINMDQLIVKNVMTPRTTLLGLNKDLSVKNVVENHPQLPYSRIPIFGEDLDDIVGMVHRYQVLELYTQNKKQLSLDEIKLPIFSISESSSISNALNQFFKLKQHALLVIDQYGSTSGLISLEDGIETLLGEDIVDEFDIVEKSHHRLETDPRHPNRLLIKPKDKEK